MQKEKARSVEAEEATKKLRQVRLVKGQGCQPYYKCGSPIAHQPRKPQVEDSRDGSFSKGLETFRRLVLAVDTW